MSKSEKIVFIINPKSGISNKENFSTLIEKHLDHTIWKPKLSYTKYAGHAQELVFSYAEQGYQHFVAVGGDGTVNEVASAVFRAGLTLGIVPTGSGNGLARFLKIPLKNAPAIKTINTKNFRTIDVGSANERLFFCTCGTGFDARIGHKFAKSKKRGFLTYVKTTIREFRKYSPKRFKLKIDNEKINRKAFLVTVANAGQYGNNAYIAPQAQIDDGYFEVSILKPFPWYAIPFLGIQLFSKRLDKSKYFEIHTGHTIIFRKKKKYKFHLDGEPIAFKGPVNIDIIPSSLKIIVP